MDTINNKTIKIMIKLDISPKVVQTFCFGVATMSYFLNF